MTSDSFAARGRSAAAAAAGAAPSDWASAVADAYAALQLAEHPKIDGNRVAIVGFSFGGEVAHLAAFASARSALRPDETRFAAHVSFYPAGSYAPVAEANAYTGAPILMLLGENDDNLPITKVEGYLSYAKAAGMPAPIELIVYSGAQHAWTASSVGAPRFCPQHGQHQEMSLHSTWTPRARAPHRWAN